MLVFHCKTRSSTERERDSLFLLLQTATVCDTSGANWQLKFRRLLFCFVPHLNSVRGSRRQRRMLLPRSLCFGFFCACHLCAFCCHISYFYISPTFQKVPSHMFRLNRHTKHQTASKPPSASVTERVWCRASALLCAANDVARACRVDAKRIGKWNCDICCDNFTATQFPAGRRDLPGSLKWLFVYRATSSLSARDLFLPFLEASGRGWWCLWRVSHYDNRHQFVDSRHQNARVCPSLCKLAAQHLRRNGSRGIPTHWSEDTLAFLVCTREGVMESLCLGCTHKFQLVLMRPVCQSNRRRRSHTGGKYDCFATTLIGSYKKHNKVKICWVY